MEFEFDPEKSASNRQKHGIDFVEAQALWFDERRVVYLARVGDEFRRGITAKIGENSWTSIYTYRKDKIRIISVRRARYEEKEHYYSEGV